MPALDLTSIVEDWPHTNDNPVQSPWYLYVGVVLESTGEVEHINELWEFLTVHFPEKDARLQVARRLREALLKTSVLVGFPRGINALAQLRTVINEQNPELGAILEKDQSIRTDIPAIELERRGLEFYDAVYGKVAGKVRSNMAKSSGGDLDQFAILSVYGELMSEVSIVNAKETGLLEFVACYVTLAAPQANGHMYGSRNLGNSKEDIEAAIRLIRKTMSAIELPFDDSQMIFTKKLDSW